MQSFSQRKFIDTEAQNMASKVSNIIGKLEFAGEDEKEFSLSSYINYLLKAAENSDAALRAEIENNIVKLNIKAVPHLVDALMTTKGPARGLAAMAIIRIGSSSVDYLKQAVVKNPNFLWMAEYMTGEILGTQAPLA
jgi:hypothetical protein